MGMSTHVIGIKPPDEKWLQMKAIYDACKRAGVDAPQEVEVFFEGEGPDSAGVHVELDGGAARKWKDDYTEGYEVDLDLLPAGVKIIRFYNSW